MGRKGDETGHEKDGKGDMKRGRKGRAGRAMKTNEEDSHVMIVQYMLAPADVYGETSVPVPSTFSLWRR